MGCLTTGHCPSSGLFWLLLYTTQLTGGGGYFWAVAIQLFLDLGKKVFFTHILLHEAEGLIFSPLIFPQSMPMGLVPMISSSQISSLMAQVTDLGLVCWDWSPGPCAH